MGHPRYKNFHSFNRNRHLSTRHGINLLIVVRVDFVHGVLFDRSRFSMSLRCSFDLATSAGHPVQNCVFVHDLMRVEELQNQVETRAEFLEALSTALGHEVDDVLFVFLAAHKA